MSLVRSGIGYAIVPELAYDGAADRDLVAIPLAAPLVQRTLGVVTRKGIPLQPRAAELLALIAETLAETIGRVTN
jgi:DNA-binding transcriptional LysR family regulator